MEIADFILRSFPAVLIAATAVIYVERRLTRLETKVDLLIDHYKKAG